MRDDPLALGDNDASAAPVAGELTDLERRLLDEFQRDLPLTSRPYADIAARLDSDEATVIAVLAGLVERGYVSRVGAVLKPGTVGASTLAAMTVPLPRLDDVAALVSSYPEVNHNYEREHALNLWFVVIGADRDHVDWVLRDIETRSGFAPLDLPILESFHIDLGFPLR